MNILYGVLKSVGMPYLCGPKDYPNGLILYQDTWNEHDPPHFMLRLDSENEMRVLITDDPPETREEVIGLDKVVPRDYKDKIVEWAEYYNKKYSMVGWDRAKDMWDKKVPEHAGSYKRPLQIKRY